MVPCSQTHSRICITGSRTQIKQQGARAARTHVARETCLQCKFSGGGYLAVNGRWTPAEFQTLINESLEAEIRLPAPAAAKRAPTSIYAHDDDEQAEQQHKRGARVPACAGAPLGRACVHAGRRGGWDGPEDADQEGPGEAHRPRQVFCFGALGLPSLCV